MTARENGVFYLNPGSASLPHYEIPRSVALLTVVDGVCSAVIQPLGMDLLL